MFSIACKNSVPDSQKVLFALFAVLMLALLPARLSYAAEPASGHNGHFSANYILNMDPRLNNLVGADTAKEVHAFFDEAEKAIETKDLKGLLGLYSDNYVNGAHKKADAENTWKRLFQDFDNLAMTHNMRFVTSDPKGGVIVMQCSGILVGESKNEKGVVALDSWMNSDHVLVKEGGKLKLIGSTGAEKKRLWFDKPMHPLF